MSLGADDQHHHPLQSCAMVAIPTAILSTVNALGHALRHRAWSLVTAESCTGGLIAATCTEIPGSSQWFDRGFITYSNSAKTQLLGVPESLIATEGAVSYAVVHAMATGALQHANTAQLSLAVTGIAGPGGAVDHKPVGTVWLAIAQRDAQHPSQPDRFTVQTRCLALQGQRPQIRQQAVKAALHWLLETAQNEC